MQRRYKTRRSAFTLLEILVVIAIITVLAALTAGAVQKLRGLGEDLDCRAEITELEKAIADFCSNQDIGAPKFMPSKITINGGDPASIDYLSKLFPRLSPPGVIPGIPSATLQGHQCLVFFLAGPKFASMTPGSSIGPNDMGWSTNPANPAMTGGKRLIFYEFKTNRLALAGSYNAYRDRWGTPYAYFSANRNDGTQWTPRQFGNDCASIGAVPYPGMNQTDYGFQIISAGQNGQFGQATGWSPTSPGPNYRRGSAGFDDIANFSGSLLGGQ